MNIDSQGLSGKTLDLTTTKTIKHFFFCGNFHLQIAKSEHFCGELNCVIPKKASYISRVFTVPYSVKLAQLNSMRNYVVLQYMLVNQEYINILKEFDVIFVSSLFTGFCLQLDIVPLTNIF